MSIKKYDANSIENDSLSINMPNHCPSCGTASNMFSSSRGSHGKDINLKIDVLETTVSSMHKILVIQGQQINHLQEIVSEQAKEISKLNVNFLQQSIINDLRNETLGPYYSQPFPLPDAPPTSLLNITEYPNISNLNIAAEPLRSDSPSSTHSTISNSSASTSLPFLLSFDHFQDNENNITNKYLKDNKLFDNQGEKYSANDENLLDIKTDDKNIIKTTKINIIDKIQELSNIHEITNQDSIPKNNSKKCAPQPPVSVEDDEDSDEDKFESKSNNNNQSESNAKRVSSQNVKKRKKLKAKKLRFNNIKSTFLAAQRFINPNPETMTTEEIQENERVLQSFKVLKVKLLSFLPTDFFTATFYGREYDLFDNVVVVMAMKYEDIHEFSNEKLQSIAAGLMDDWNFCAKNWS